MGWSSLPAPRALPPDPQIVDAENAKEQPTVVLRRQGQAKRRSGGGRPAPILESPPIGVGGKGDEESNRDVERGKVTVVEDPRKKAQRQSSKQRAT